jgi:hypothetical protein
VTTPARKRTGWVALWFSSPSSRRKRSGNRAQAPSAASGQAKRPSSWTSAPRRSRSRAQRPTSSAGGRCVEVADLDLGRARFGEPRSQRAARPLPRTALLPTHPAWLSRSRAHRAGVPQTRAHWSLVSEGSDGMLLLDHSQAKIAPTKSARTITVRSSSIGPPPHAPLPPRAAASWLPALSDRPDRVRYGYSYRFRWLRSIR